MKVAVIGSNGQLGSDVVRQLELNGDQAVALTHEQIELRSLDSVREVLQQVGADVVVNTAAVHHVEKCEAAPEHAFAVNAIGARNLAIYSRDAGSALVHVSTDYVFDGWSSTPYCEEDLPAPLNVYGISKLAGEQCIGALTPRHIILRTSGLYGHSPCRDKGPNFVETMLRLASERDEIRVVDSEVLTPTSTIELARQIVRVVHSDRWGLYHATAEGQCSWYEFAREVFRRAGVKVPLQVAGPDEFPVKVPRPAFSVLENRRLRQEGLHTLSSWQKGLEEYLLSRSASSVFQPCAGAALVAS